MAPTAPSWTSIRLAANWLVYNPFDFRLYASVGSLQGADGNSVAVIDPYTSTVVKSIFVGSEPRKMALSDDGESLWVALDGAGTVRQVDLVSQSAGQQFSVGSDGLFDTWFADSLAVLPGTHSSVVLTRYNKRSTATDGPIVYDDGVPRAYSTLTSPTDIIPTYSAQLVFGYDKKSAGLGLTTDCVNANGLFTKQAVNPFGSSNISFSFAQNVIYGSTGAAYDIASGTTLGTFAEQGPVAADATTRSVYFLSVETRVGLSAYDMDTFLSKGSEALNPPILPSSFFTNLVRWGRYGYAFLANYEAVIIARSALIAAGP